MQSMIDPEDGHVYYWPTSNPTPRRGDTMPIAHTWSAWEADTPALRAGASVDPVATTATAATLYDYFNNLWTDAARVDDETAHLAADVHICTHARRLADIAVLEAAQHDAFQRLADLIAYTSRARRAGSRESVRLQQNPAQVVACIEDYARDVLALLAGEACEHGQACPREDG